MNARRCLATAALVVAIVPLAGEAGPTHEVGHYLILSHSFDGPSLALDFTTVDGVPIPVPVGSLTTKRGTSFSLDCLELVESRTGPTQVFASFSSLNPGTPPELAVMAALVESGVMTEGYLGYSDERTSTDRCGAGALAVEKVDAFTVKQSIKP